MRLFVAVAMCSWIFADACIAAPTADLTKYFASDEAEASDRAHLTDALTSFQAKTRPRPAALRAQLDAYAALVVRTRDHDAYLHLRCAQDRKRGTACADEEALDAKADALEARLEAAFDALPERLASARALAPYRHVLQDWRRTAAHRAPPAQEETLAKLGPQVQGWQYDLYQDALDKIDFGIVKGPNGPLDVAKQRNVIAVSPDASVREAGYRARLAGLAKARDAAAFALAHIVSTGNTIAAMRGFATAADEKYFALGFDPTATRRLLDRLAKDGDLLKRLEALRIRELAAVSRAPHPGPWDMRALAADVPPVSFDAAPKLYHEVFASLGADYQHAFDALAAPDSKRLDIAFAPAPGRAGGGFSVGGGDAPSMLFVGNFGGTYKDLSVIAHEGGHAVHRELMRLNRVPAPYREGPHYLFESFAVFNELVMADYLAAHAQDEAARRYYTEQFLGVKGLDYLLGADDALLEQSFYDTAKAGHALTPDALDALTLDADGRFSQWPAQVPELKSRWIGMELAYEDPLYDVNYVYGGMLALAYYKAWRADRDGFDTAYIALLRNGFDDTPEALLKRFLHIDLDDAGALAASARAVVEEKFAFLDAPH